MNAPVHFDLDQIEREARKRLRETVDDALSHAKSPEARQFVHLQEEFLELHVAALLMVIRCENQGRPPRMVARALGNAVGMIVGFFLENNQHRPDACSDLLETIWATTDGVMSGKPSKNATMVKVRFRGTEGGTA